LGKIVKGGKMVDGSLIEGLKLDGRKPDGGFGEMMSLKMMKISATQ